MCSGPESKEPVENVLWKGEAPQGKFKVSVVNCSYNCPNPASDPRVPCKFTVHVVKNGVMTEHHGVTHETLRTAVPVKTFRRTKQDQEKWPAYKKRIDDGWAGTGIPSNNSKNMRVELHIV